MHKFKKPSSSSVVCPSVRPPSVVRPSSVVVHRRDRLDRRPSSVDRRRSSFVVRRPPSSSPSLTLLSRDVTKWSFLEQITKGQPKYRNTKDHSEQNMLYVQQRRKKRMLWLVKSDIWEQVRMVNVKETRLPGFCKKLLPLRLGSLERWNSSLGFRSLRRNCCTITERRHLV